MNGLTPVVITIIFIALSTFVGAFIKGRKKDKCLKAFSGFIITLEDVSGKRIWGRLNVEATGMELMYTQEHDDADGHIESSYMLYKYEYGNISSLIRYHDYLSKENLKRRDAELKKTYHPGWSQRTRRKIANVFKTVRDSIMEVSNVLLSQAKKTTGAGTMLKTQDKYVSQMKNQMIGSVDTAYEPFLEKYIGHRVIAEFLHKDQPVELAGVLKDYTAEFIELLDTEYWTGKEDQRKKADLILPRKRAVIRHLAE
ncbi:MAG: hypothetical protein B6I25_06635 [Planctomycetales bacterium 4572_13]|nr:MAG: hypothetical protein B6I25_06635 [Planctomycetales bacterium 4572_13]